MLWVDEASAARLVAELDDSALRFEDHLDDDEVVRYVLGDLAEPRQTAGVEAHLQTCPECRDLVADLRSAVRSQTRFEKAGPRRASYSLFKVFQAAASVAVIALFAYVWSEGASRSSQGTVSRTMSSESRSLVERVEPATETIRDVSMGTEAFNRSLDVGGCTLTSTPLFEEAVKSQERPRASRATWGGSRNV